MNEFEFAWQDVTEDFFGDYGDVPEFATEDDYIVNRNDPVLRERSPFAASERSFKLSVEDARVIGIAGPLAEEMADDFITDEAGLEDSEFDLPDDMEDGEIDAAVEKISMAAHLGANTKKQKVFKRPFEQWIDDITTGKKTLRDPL